MLHCTALHCTALHCTALQGTIPKIVDLPTPWGNKPYTAPPDEALASSGYLPAKYGQGYSPLTDVSAA